MKLKPTENKVPRHVGIILDGNRRFAKRLMLKPWKGHEWGAKKLSDSFGVASSHVIIQAMDDMWVADNTGSITSLQATQAFGDIKSGDILAANQVEEYIKTQMVPDGYKNLQAIYYQEKKRAYFTGTSNGDKQNRILILDIARQTPRITIETKDQPTCLGLRKDNQLIPRPFYGADDGKVWLMEQGDYTVDGLAYNAEFQTPYIDFSYLDPSLASKNKLFDFLEIQYLATGAWSFNVSVYIDDKLSETITIKQPVGGTLDAFVLDTDRLSVESSRSNRVPLHGCGRRISFKIFNNVIGQFFKVEKLVINFRLSAEQSTTGGAFSV